MQNSSHLYISNPDFIFDLKTHTQDLIDVLHKILGYQPAIVEFLAVLYQDLEIKSDQEYFQDISPANIKACSLHLNDDIISLLQNKAVHAHYNQLASHDYFDLQAHFFDSFATKFQEKFQKRPTLEEFNQAIIALVRECFPFTSINNISIHVKSKKVKFRQPKPGDLFAIPVDQDKFLHVLYLNKNKFGSAFRIFLGQRELEDFSEDDMPNDFILPLYSCLDEIKKGNWIFVKNCPSALSHFLHQPGEVPIYHDKKFNQHDDEIGEFGAFEYFGTPSKSINLTENDLQKLKPYLTDYHQFLLSEDIKDWVLSMKNIRSN